MGVDLGPRGRKSRREQFSLDLFSKAVSETSKLRKGLPGRSKDGSRLKLSEYGEQLRRKQALKRIYGVREGQFKNYFKEAARKTGSTGGNLVILLEQRFDNVLYRAGFARTRREARQLISHRACLVNQRIVNIPSYLVQANEIIALRPAAARQGRVQEAIHLTASDQIPQWMQVSQEESVITIKRLPLREEIQIPVNEDSIVELYSK